MAKGKSAEEQKKQMAELGKELLLQLNDLAPFESMQIADAIWEKVPGGWVRTTGDAEIGFNELFIPAA